ncbi:MAG: amidohydrolase/deacetylase family metallohydrolase [Gemmatimonadetes bacterium]|nr:amidohydrolase/deacetylase family metallohydrolase [Gemmatimonadota bacterium]
MLYDLLLKGGTLVDPAQKLHAVQDVAFTDGKVAAVGADLPADQARQTLDVAGNVVAPGLIDLHVHVFWGVSHFGVEPDPTCLARGVTTAVDAGSAGADTFPGFRKFIIDVSDTRILAQLNISSQGMLTQEIGEFEIPEYADVGKACRMIEQHRDLILGVKVRLTRNSIVSERSGMLPLHRAREAADAAGLPIMVHPQDAWCDSLDDVLAVMKRGDILTHCFHGMKCGILDEAGQVRPAVHEAVERGVLFDVGHGAGSFSWEVAETALSAGLAPHTISSDLHVYNLNGPVYDLVNVASKFLHLDMDLDTALAKVTAVPAQVIGMPDEIGTLAVGAWGDAVVLDVREGQFQLADSGGEIRTGDQQLEPLIVVKGGRVYRQY